MRQDDELQTGIEFSLTVFPQSAACVEPSKSALDDPPLRHHGKGRKRVALGHLHGCPEPCFDRLGKGLPRL